MFDIVAGRLYYTFCSKNPEGCFYKEKKLFHICIVSTVQAFCEQTTGKKVTFSEQNNNILLIVM